MLLGNRHLLSPFAPVPAALVSCRALDFKSVNTSVRGHAGTPSPRAVLQGGASVCDPSAARQALHPCAGFGSTAGNACSRE